MPTATMTSKGQITIPKEVREQLRLEPGSQVVFLRQNTLGYRIVPRTNSVKDTFAFADSLSPGDTEVHSVTEEEEAMAHAIADHVLNDDSAEST